MARICKKCDVNMDMVSLKVKRGGKETKNVTSEYYCPKCDHT